MSLTTLLKQDLTHLRAALGSEYADYRSAMRGAGLWTEDTVLDKLTSLDDRTPGCACHPLTDDTCSVCRTQANERQAGYKAPFLSWEHDYNDDDIPF